MQNEESTPVASKKLNRKWIYCPLQNTLIKKYHAVLHEKQRMPYCRHKTSSDSSRAHHKDICIKFGLRFTSCPPNCCFHRLGKQAARRYVKPCSLRRMHEEFQLRLADSESLQEQATLPASSKHRLVA